MARLREIAEQISAAQESIHLIYAFNATGKTRLSMEYKELTKGTDNHLTGFYYNAFSEDLFLWDNDNIELLIRESPINKIHSQLTEDIVREKLQNFDPKYDFRFNTYDDVEKGIESVTFFLKDDANMGNIKLSRGEERIFIWCFFLAIFDTNGWESLQNSYIFIDDPVSSIDEYNIFRTIFSIEDLILKYYDKRKIIITTHHIGMASIISDWLSKGEMKDKFTKSKGKEKLYSIKLLERIDDDYRLSKPNVLLYHLRILQILKDAIENNNIEMYHIALLRQILENISSFLGAGNLSYVLQAMGYNDSDKVSNILNAFTHKNIYSPQSDLMTEDNRQLVKDIFKDLMNKFRFKI